MADGADGAEAAMEADAFDAAADAATEAGCAEGSTTQGPLPLSVSVAGDVGSTEGIFDPSVIEAADSGAGAIVYSTLDPDQLHIHTRIAGTSDHGQTWTYVADVNQNDPVTIQAANSVCGAATCSGRWNHEVASLVVDPADPNPAHRFRVFTHTYFAGSTTWFDTIGYISLFTAPDATGPWTETKLLGWSSPLSPDGSQGVTQNVSTDASLAPLARCLLLTEPGALVHTLSTGQKVIDLALGCAVPLGQGAAVDVVLLRSTDGAASFQYVSRPLTAQDAQTLGFADPSFNGADLFEQGGQVYLFATPAGPVMGPSGTFIGYTGCLLFAFADADQGTLVRCGAAPSALASFLPPPQAFFGACTYAEGATALGVAGDQPDFSTMPIFRIAASGKPPL